MAEIFQSLVQIGIPAVFHGKLPEKLPRSGEVGGLLRYADAKGMVVFTPEF
ncbi:hypothetical protein [Rheinheimera texasensis]|uniref:hypothetical protein n=1 Tax=Rheinheimera texasensis TaxID=306205 RepID=UPI0032B262E3